ncbi:RraA-like protein [Penicillium lividum]|nr:RraA-like protein [Penicillium lividum]
MYIQQPKDLPFACWGGLMSTRAQKLGSLGTVINGRMRDVQEHRDMGFPVSVSRPYGDLLEFHHDILRTKRVNWSLLKVIGDENGVVVLPPSLLKQVVELCQARFEIDEKTMEALRVGESMASAIERLRK